MTIGIISLSTIGVLTTARLAILIARTKKSGDLPPDSNNLVKKSGDLPPDSNDLVKKSTKSKVLTLGRKYDLKMDHIQKQEKILDTAYKTVTEKGSLEQKRAMECFHSFRLSKTPYALNRLFRKNKLILLENDSPEIKKLLLENDSPEIKKLTGYSSVNLTENNSLCLAVKEYLENLSTKALVANFLKAKAMPQAQTFDYAGFSQRLKKQEEKQHSDFMSQADAEEKEHYLVQLEKINKELKIETMQIQPEEIALYKQRQQVHPFESEELKEACYQAMITNSQKGEQKNFPVNLKIDKTKKSSQPTETKEQKSSNIPLRTCSLVEYESNYPRNWNNL